MNKTLQTQNGYDDELIIHVTPEEGLVVRGTFEFSPLEVWWMYLNDDIFLKKISQNRLRRKRRQSQPNTKE